MRGSSLSILARTSARICLLPQACGAYTLVACALHHTIAFVHAADTLPYLHHGPRLASRPPLSSVQALATTRAGTAEARGTVAALAAQLALATGRGDLLSDEGRRLLGDALLAEAQAARVDGATQAVRGIAAQHSAAAATDDEDAAALRSATHAAQARASSLEAELADLKSRLGAAHAGVNAALERFRVAAAALDRARALHRDAAADRASAHADFAEAAGAAVAYEELVQSLRAIDAQHRAQQQQHSPRPSLLHGTAGGAAAVADVAVVASVKQAPAPAVVSQAAAIAAVAPPVAVAAPAAALPVATTPKQSLVAAEAAAPAAPVVATPAPSAAAPAPAAAAPAPAIVATISVAPVPAAAVAPAPAAAAAPAPAAAAAPAPALAAAPQDAADAFGDALVLTHSALRLNQRRTMPRSTTASPSLRALRR